MKSDPVLSQLLDELRPLKLPDFPIQEENRTESQFQSSDNNTNTTNTTTNTNTSGNTSPNPSPNPMPYFPQVEDTEYLGPNPAQPVVASNRLPKDLIYKIKCAFLSIHTSSHTNSNSNNSNVKSNKSHANSNISHMTPHLDAMKSMRCSRYVSVDSELYTPTELYMSYCHGVELLGGDANDNYTCHS